MSRANLLTLKAKEKVSLPVSMSIPEDLKDGSVLRLMIWNTDTLACGGDCVFTTTLKDDQGQDAEAGKYPQRKTGPGTSSANGRCSWR